MPRTEHTNEQGGGGGGEAGGASYVFKLLLLFCVPVNLYGKLVPQHRVFAANRKKNNNESSVNKGRDAYVHVGCTETNPFRQC